MIHTEICWNETFQRRCEKQNAKGDVFCHTVRGGIEKMSHGQWGQPTFSGQLSAWSHVSGVTCRTRYLKDFSIWCLILFQRLSIFLFLFPHNFSLNWDEGRWGNSFLTLFPWWEKNVRGIRRSFTSSSPTLANRSVPLVNSSDYKHTQYCSDYLTHSLGNQRSFLVGMTSLH